jgi:predicted aldo/keto reductase-like oxidoreductase
LAQYNFKHPQRGEIKKAFSYASQAGLGTLAMKTHAGRFWDKENRYPININAAIKWAVGDKTVDSALYRISSIDEIRICIAIMNNLKLTPAEKKDLKLGEKYGFNGLFCPQCGKCKSQCSEKLDIPTLMRGYMYAYGYRQPLFAKETIENVVLTSVPCSKCPACNVSCTMGFDVREKVTDITRLKNVPDEFLTG